MDFLCLYVSEISSYFNFQSFAICHILKAFHTIKQICHHILVWAELGFIMVCRHKILMIWSTEASIVGERKNSPQTGRTSQTYYFVCSKQLTSGKDLKVMHFFQDIFYVSKVFYWKHFQECLIDVYSVAIRYFFCKVDPFHLKPGWVQS